MKDQNWTYMLRILRRNPDQIRMDRLAEYIREFALLLGLDNDPVFKGIRKASTGLKARVPASRRQHAWKRLETAKYDPLSKPGRHLNEIGNMLGEDSIKGAELLDASCNVVYLFDARPGLETTSLTIKQDGEVDGVVTGLVGADDTMHLHLRDDFNRDLKFVLRNVEMARHLLEHFRRGTVRLKIHGHWSRTEDGWVPDNNRCVVDSFEPLDDESALDVFNSLASIQGNRWCEVENPIQIWRDLRGVN